MIIFLNVDENHDEVDCDGNENLETIDDDVNENDDEIRSKKKSTKVTLRFFFSSTENNIFEEERTTKFNLRFFFLSVNNKIFEKKRTTRFDLRFFFFFFKRASKDDDIVIAIFVLISRRDEIKISIVIFAQSSLIEVIFFRTSRSEFFNRWSMTFLNAFIVS
jgi:hypothetical protein